MEDAATALAEFKFHVKVHLILCLIYSVSLLSGLAPSFIIFILSLSLSILSFYIQSL